MALECRGLATPHGWVLEYSDPGASRQVLAGTGMPALEQVGRGKPPFTALIRYAGFNRATAFSGVGKGKKSE